MKAAGICNSPDTAHGGPGVESQDLMAHPAPLWPQRLSCSPGPGARGLPTLRAFKSLRHPRSRSCRQVPRAQLTMPVDPTLGLWQQQQVQSAGLQCALAVSLSFLTARLLNYLVSKAVNKVGWLCACMLCSASAMLAWTSTPLMRGEISTCHESPSLRPC